MLHLQTSPLLFNPAFHPPHTNKPGDNDPLGALIYPRKPAQKDLKLADNQTNRYKCTDRQILDPLLWCQRFLANVKCKACFRLVFLFWQCLLDHILGLALFTPNHPQCNTSLLLKVRRTPDALNVCDVPTPLNSFCLPATGKPACCVNLTHKKCFASAKLAFQLVSKLANASML